MFSNPGGSCAMIRLRRSSAIPRSKRPTSAMWEHRYRVMPLDLVLRNARLVGRSAETFDIAIADGKIAEIGSISTDAAAEDVGGRLVMPGFVETHIHLDKSCILDRCHPETGTLQE